MKKLVKSLFLLGCLFAGQTFADMGLPSLDRTDKVHDRRYLDSLNVYNRRPIRLNQSGFRPQDYKYAYVADPKETSFTVIDANSGKEAFSGSLSLIKANAIKPNIWINGAFNSLESVYEFGKMDSISTEKESLYRADFTQLQPKTPGEYFIVVGKDTSATFHIHPSVFNAILEKSLQFFGIQRCGNTKSHFHGACHLKDGSKIGHDLTGGWHDCGDHFKVSETLGYTAYVLSMVYLTYENKAEDRYGNSYADTVFTDGIPDILYEAKVGTDYLLKLYRASKADGLIEQGDMYHSVGVDEVDHAYWDLPERQDAQSPQKGGPDRVILTGIGSNTAGMFIAAMANVAKAYQVYDANYSDSLLAAAKDMYENVLMPSFGDYMSGGLPGKTTDFPGFYTGGGPLYDDGAAAALAMWYATKDTTYQYDLYKNKKIFDNATNYKFNMDYFGAGFLGNPSGFTQGGWATDYQNIHSYVLFAFQKLILSDESVAASYGLSPAERDTLSMRTMATFRKVLDNSTNDGDSLVLENPATQGEPHEGSSKLHVITPYNLVWTSFDWGVMRYNMGTANAIFLMYELTGDKRYLNVALDNMYFILGANPWDISFLMGAGDKNPQHPHNRASNPDGYNAGGMPYKYRCPVGALMGARDPTKTLIEDWSKYTSTETCIDFTAQFLFPAQSLAETLPIDAEGPLFSNIAGTPITDTSAIISWDANEVALVTVFYNTTPSTVGAKSVQQDKASKGGAVTLNGLTMGTTYYFFLEGMDTKRNMTTDDNHGQWYKFTMTSASTNISGVTICQVDHRSAKIYWWSSDRMNGIVNFSSMKGVYDNTQAASGGAVLFHEALLTDLDPGTTYYFSVSSGTTTDDNGGQGYSFTTESYASYADLNISLKPSAYQEPCTDWKDCRQFIISISNNDTIPFEDFEMRLYLNSPDLTAMCNIVQKFGGGGVVNGSATVSFGAAKPDGKGAYYLPIKVNGVLEVSGQLLFQVAFKDYNPQVKTATFGDLDGSWSLRPHLEDDAPEKFKGIDLTKGPLYIGSETAFLETVNGNKEVAFVEDPYIAVYYHGKHIYGYGPDYTPENGPQVHRTVDLQFTKPFVSPHYSVEKLEYETEYEGFSKVSPTGFIDDFEMNGATQPFTHDPANKTDAIVFYKDTTLAYGNNYMEWVSWHNHGANKKAENKYDCACAVVRSNVEIDTITTPPEKRYLVFNKSEYSTYTGKKTEVVVNLYDSLGTPITDEMFTLELNVETGNAEFWSSLDATIPITSITIVNGEATFYVSSETPLSTTLFGRIANNAKFVYEAAEAALKIEDLPPWPIIDIAKMVDTDCDNIPDAIQITLSNEYQNGQTFNSVVFVYKKDTLTTTNVISLNGKDLVVKANIADTTVNTNPEGYIALLSNTENGVQKHEYVYQDGISPTLLSISVLERLDTAKTDKVYMQFSEPISAPGSDWPVQLFASNKTNMVDAPSVKFTQLYNDSLNIWEFEIGFAADGSSIVTEGMFAKLLSNAGIKDKNGNGISSCEPPMLPITLKLIPVPMVYAAISDANEDGLAEHVDIEFEREVDERHVPNKISVIFGRTEPETLWVAGSELSFNSSRTEATLDFKQPFRLGNTSGTYSGSSRGMAIENAGLVVQHLGEGASYESSNVLGEDKAGPVFYEASISSVTSDFSNLKIKISEPVNVTDSSRVYYRQKLDGIDTSIYKHDVYKISIMNGNSTLTSTFDVSSDLAPSEGGFVRMQPKEFSALVDQSGNMPANNNPWIPIGSSGDVKVKFKVKLVNEDNVGTSGGPNRSQVASSESVRLYVQNPNTKMLDLVIGGQVVTQGIDSTMMNGTIWRIELNVPRGGASSEDAAWESLKFKYNIPIYSNLGSYVNRSAGSFIVTPQQYLSSASKVVFFVEWANMVGTGLQSENGRAIATGAYVYKAQLEAKFTPNPSKDPETTKRFSSSTSYDKTEVFGVRRTK